MEVLPASFEIDKTLIKVRNVRALHTISAISKNREYCLVSTIGLGLNKIYPHEISSFVQASDRSMIDKCRVATEELAHDMKSFRVAVNVATDVQHTVEAIGFVNQVIDDKELLSDCLVDTTLSFDQIAALHLFMSEANDAMKAVFMNAFKEVLVNFVEDNYF